MVVSTVVSMPRKNTDDMQTGQLRIGDTWNAITIIALSQNSPLKAIAEFVENSIDAKARNVTIVRGKDRGRNYLRVMDDGEGIPRDENGIPDFKYVATHICDSIKREMRERGATGIQGEYGIGLLSFWTIGSALKLTCAGSDGHTYEMHMSKGDPGYTIKQRRVLLPSTGVELEIAPLLPGIRQLSGEKIQWYLASELRDRIRSSGVHIKVLDRHSRKEFSVEPRQFTGRLLHQLPPANCPLGDVYLELYLASPAPEHKVSLCRSGTRVMEDITRLDCFAKEPWASACIEGIVDAPFLRLTPGTRDGIIRDDAYEALCRALQPVELELTRLINEQREAEEQKASKEVLKSVQKALREALLALPADEYDWFDVHGKSRGAARQHAAASPGKQTGELTGTEAEEPPDSGTDEEPTQRQFFEFEGPLFSVRISPSSAAVGVRGSRDFRAIARDRSRRLVEKNLSFKWSIAEGDGLLASADGECVSFVAPAEPCLVRIEVVVRQGELECVGEAIVTVTESAIGEDEDETVANLRKGMPGYTFQKAPGELWRSRYDEERNLVIINNGHRDFVFASRNNARKLRYVCRLFAKELVLRNFSGIPPDQLIERMIELSLYTEENL